VRGTRYADWFGLWSRRGSLSRLGFVPCRGRPSPNMILSRLGRTSLMLSVPASKPWSAASDECVIFSRYSPNFCHHAGRSPPRFNCTCGK
jgi:hypothetical protein